MSDPIGPAPEPAPGTAAAHAPAVSVIVRSRGSAALAAALESIAAQDGVDAEVIVVAASGPGHPAVPARCGAHPMRLIAAEMPLDAPAAANRGIAAARGEWIAVLDDADSFLPGHLGALMAERAAAPDAGVIHAFARVMMPDGSSWRFGHPFSLAELYAEDFIHISAAVFRRAFAATQGCRFDETLRHCSEWDFLIQLGRLTRFRFVPRDAFQWNLATGRGVASVEAYEALVAPFSERVRAKWKAERDALIGKVEPMLHSAAEWSQQGDHLAAEACCHDALAASPNDPWALNLLASIQRATGRATEARRTQEFAVALRPADPAFVFNLALLCRAQGDLAIARRCCDRALALDPQFEPAARLRAELPA